jgi:hypothetical protein
MLTTLIYVLILWGIIALAWLGAWWLKRRGTDTSGQFTNTAVFVGFLFGFLLTTLQVFATNHYSDARSQAQSEPTSLATMYDDLGAFPPHVRTTGRRDVICYMWSVAEGDWKAQERGEAQESPETVVWGDRLRSFRNSLPQDSPATQAGSARVSTDLTNADNARQQLLFLAQPQIPTILWVVVFVSGGLLIFLQVSDSQSQGKIARRSMLTAVIVLMTLEVASLAVLDRPFSPIARIQPTAMTAAIGLLEAGRTGQPTAQDCGLPATTSSYRQPRMTWSVVSVGSAAYAMRPPSAWTSRSAFSAVEVISSPGASTGTPGG